MAPSPLLLTGDDDLAADVLRLAAAVGVTVDVERDLDQAARRWAAPPLIIIGADLASALASLRLPRRTSTVVVTPGDRDRADYRLAVALGVTDVLGLPADEGLLIDLLADVAEQRQGSGAVLAVVGASGGVGASTLAAGIALRAARDRDVVLVDLDPLGRGLDDLTGVAQLPGIRWPQLAGTQGRLGSQALRDALPGHDGLRVLAWGVGAPCRLPDSTLDIVAALRRGSDLVVLDLPRWVLSPGIEEHEMAILLTQLLARSDQTVLVGECSVGGLSAAAPVVTALTAHGVLPWFVGRRPPGAASAADVARAVGLPLTAVVPDQRGLLEQVELGLGPVHARRGAITRAADRLVERLRETGVVA